MSEHISRCYRCQAPNPAWGQTICAACRQVEAIEKQTEQATELAEERAYQLATVAERNAEIQREQARMQEDQHWESMQLAKQNAKLAREQSAKNARLTAEGGVSSDDAFKFGLHSGQDYIDSDNFGGGGDEITINLTEAGDINIRRYSFFKPYMMEHLLQAYDRGLKSSIKKFKKPGFEHMKKQAYSAGLNLQSKFQLDANDSSYTTRKGEAAIIFSVKYDSGLVRTIDTTTGYVRYGIKNNPFETPELNEAYSDGVADAQASENTDEEVSKRLVTEVPRFLANQARAAEEHRVAVENERIRQENDWAENRKRMAQRESEKNIRKAIAAVILLAIVGSIVGLWIVGHPVFSVLAGFVTICGFLGGGIDLVIDFVEG
jgi:hypothetical protein